MLRYITINLTLILVFQFEALSQTQISYEFLLRQKFEEFDYHSVINISDSILTVDKKLTRSDSITILYYKALSLFHIWDIKNCELTFERILSIDQNFQLDTINVSPKIVSYFNEIKNRYISYKINERKDQSKNIDTLLILEREKLVNRFIIYQNAIKRNLILPGSGNLYLNNKGKGYFTIGLYSASLLSSFYFYFDTKTKEKDYLNELNPDLIQSKYSRYNTSYKLRNISLLTSFLIYLYSQVDILFLNEKVIHSDKLLHFSTKSNGYSDFTVSLSLNF